jgi:hypothetical protein
LSLAHALATVLGAALTGFDRSPKPGQRPPDPSPFDGSPRPDEPPDAGPLDHRQALRRRYEPSSPRRSVSGRSLRQGRQGDTVEAIAPDAATLRSRHVARRMDCGSSLTLLRITTLSVVDIGRAQVAARCAGGPPRVRLPTVVPLH